MRKIDNIVIHCTATPQMTTVQQIQAYWRNVLKWRNPGYHIIVMPSGMAVELAHDSVVCNGVKGHNENSLHISYIGGVDGKNKPFDNRTEAQKVTMIKYIINWRWKYPSAKILGHRDFKGVNKACPSFDVQKWLNEVNFNV
jgi:N-acetylmuramoyl-L-alanine amidase